jgi:hypothetical protein
MNRRTPTVEIRERAGLFAALLVLALLGPLAPAQAPGTRPKAEPPRTKEEKVRQVKDAFQNSIDWNKVPTGPGEVDERVKGFLKRAFGVEGAGFANVGKTPYLIAVGQETLTGERKVGWVQNRILALNKAELQGRVQMADLISQEISSGQFFERFDGYPETVMKQLKELKKTADAGALSADRYKEANGTFATAQVAGAITIKTIEGPNNGQYKVVRVLVWRPLLRDLALNALADTDYMLPAEKLKDAELDQIPTKEEELVRELGTKVYFNKQGQRYYVSYGQAEPITDSQDEVPRALDIARSRAELQAKGSLARTLATEVTSINLDEMTQTLEKLGKDQKKESLTGGFYQCMESVSKRLKVRGVMVHKTWQYKHPDWPAPVVGAVVVWTPENRSVIQELGLDRRFDVSSPENLAAFLTQKYGKGGTGGAGGKVPGENDSKDPKKIP